MSSGHRGSSSSFRTPTGSEISSQNYQKIFDAYLYQYLLKRNYLTSARHFRQEAQVEDMRSMLFTESPGDFLFEWWTIFYDTYSARHENQRASDLATFSQPNGAQVGRSSSSSMCDTGTTSPFWSRQAGALVPAHHELVPMTQVISVTTTAGAIPHWPTHDGEPVPDHHELLLPVMPVISTTASGADVVPPYWQTLGVSPLQAPAQATMTTMPRNVNINFQSIGDGMRPFGSSNAFVLTRGNVNCVGPSQLPQPRPPRRVKRGMTISEPIETESSMSSPASAPRGTRPRVHFQPVSRGSPVMGTGVMPAAGLVSPPAEYQLQGSMGMASSIRRLAVASMANPSAAIAPLVPPTLTMSCQVAYLSGPQLHPLYQILNSASASVSSSKSVPTASMATCNALTLKTLEEMLASTSRRAAEQDAANVAMLAPCSSRSGQFGQGQVELSSDQNSIPVTITGTLGEPITVARIAGREIEGPSDDQPGLGTDENVKVSSAMLDTNMLEADEDGEEENKEDENDVVGKYLNNNDGTEADAESETDTAPVASAQLVQTDLPQPQPDLPQPKQQASNFIVVRDEASGIEFKQEACLESNLSKVWCCDFSSTGKYLACAGLNRKVIVWNLGTFTCAASEECHDEAIIDIRFSPNSPIFATGSFDKKIYIWDASKPEKALMHLNGHAAKVTSVDFQPLRFDILASCDGNGEIRFWNLTNQSCLLVTQGASQQVRFQPQKGKYLAAADGNTINILDSETGDIIHCLKGHIRPVECMCWDASGRYLVSTSQDSAHIWSVANWCASIHKLMAKSDQNFKSCIFHPAISQVVIIGSDKNLGHLEPGDTGPVHPRPHLNHPGPRLEYPKPRRRGSHPDQSGPRLGQPGPHHPPCLGHPGSRYQGPLLEASAI
uniref:Uncharacterized protein n=1 Tax=Kalanchoe fedtschenkoi TaxID=63787 RepID=A0A7N0ZUS7_KALFE